MKEDFEKALEQSGQCEIQYSDQIVGKGGEAYMGITREAWPSWQGWQIIDAHKQAAFGAGKKGVEARLTADSTLQEMIVQFYREHYWDIIHGDEMPTELALEMFYTSINLAPHWAVLFLQKALNILNLNEKLYPDLAEDGCFGGVTKKAVEKALSYKGPETGVKVLLAWYTICEGDYYIEMMKCRTDHEAFAWDWAERIHSAED